MNKHTPGPWRIGWNYGAVVADTPVPEMDGSDRVAAYGGHMVGESIAPRNRALIAAAPELLEAAVAALEDVMSIDNEHSLSPDVGRKLRAAIDKATGAMP